MGGREREGPDSKAPHWRLNLESVARDSALLISLEQKSAFLLALFFCNALSFSKQSQSKEVQCIVWRYSALQMQREAYSGEGGEERTLHAFSPPKPKMTHTIHTGRYFSDLRQLIRPFLKAYLVVLKSLIYPVKHQLICLSAALKEMFELGKSGVYTICMRASCSKIDR